MSTARLLPVLNAIGCVVLAGFILVQWRGSQSLSRELHESRSREILEKNARFDAEKLSRQLQADLDGLKASVDSIQQAAEVAEKELATKNEEIGKFATGLAQVTEQVKTWEAAVKERDEALLARDAAIAERDGKLKEINSRLVETRKRLDEAVSELKKAGAR